MLSVRVNIVLLFVGGAFALGLAGLTWALAPTSSEAQQDAMYNCPQAGKWAISVWNGDDGTTTSEALATCDAAGVDAAYYIDPETQAWQRWFAGRPELSTLGTLGNMQGVIAVGTTGAVPPTPSPTPTPLTPGVSVDVQLSIACFQSFATAAGLETAIYVQQQAGFPTTVLDVQLATEDDFIQQNCLSVAVVLVDDPSSADLCGDAIALAASIEGSVAVLESEGMPHVYLSLQLDQLNTYIQSSCI